MLTDLHDIHEKVLGALFVLVFAYRRFNSPRTNRSSTTALRYYTAAAFYGVFALALYSALIGFPDLLRHVLEAGSDVLVPDWAKHLSSPLLVGLIRTLLLPNAPSLSGVAESIRQLFLSLASIPLEVQLLGARLQRARLSVRSAFQNEIATRLLLDGFDRGDVVFDAGRSASARSPQQAWTKITALMTRLDTWKRERRYIGFIAGFADELAALENSYRQLAVKAKKCFSLKRSLDDAGVPAAGTGAADFQRDFLAQGDELLARITHYISRGILQCNPTDSGRNRELQRLGFQGRFPRTRLTLNQLVWLFVGILVVVLTGFLVFGEGVRLEKALLHSAMIAAIYVVAVICAVYPKRRWKLARFDGGGLRPATYYLVVGLMAAVASRLISLPFTFSLMPAVAWQKFLQSYPWCLMSFMTAATVALLMDNRPTVAVTRSGLRVIEGLAQGGVTLVSGLVVYGWLLTTGPIPSFTLDTMLTMSTIIGCAIGFLVPTWYREAPYRNERRPGERGWRALSYRSDRRSADRRLPLQPATLIGAAGE